MAMGRATRREFLQTIGLTGAAAAVGVGASAQPTANDPWTEADAILRRIKPPTFAERCRMDSPHLGRALRFKTNAERGGVIERVAMRRRRRPGRRGDRHRRLRLRRRGYRRLYAGAARHPRRPRHEQEEQVRVPAERLRALADRQRPCRRLHLRRCRESRHPAERQEHDLHERPRQRQIGIAARWTASSRSPAGRISRNRRKAG